MTTAIDYLPDLLSLDVTAGLVALDLRASWKAPANVGDAETYTLSVLDASNTSPIVITVAQGDLGVLDPRGPDPDHGYAGRVMHVVVAGVLGNTAANKLDAKTLRNEAWVAIALTPTTLALYDLDNSSGRLLASTGNGAYTGRGTVSKALVDGLILVGSEHIKEVSAAPRIVFVPKRTTYGPADARSSFTATAIADGEVDRERTDSTFRTVVWWYEVHVWGIAPPGTTNRIQRSFGACELLHHQVLRSAQSRCSGVFDLGAGAWIDQHDNAPQRVKFGHELVFQLGLSAPITREPVELSPIGTTVDAILSLQLAGDTPEET